MVGTVLGHYRILERLGSGGAGVVWAAEDARLGRRVALKFLSDTLLRNPEARARFEREARAVAALDHPNIGTLYTLEEDAAGDPFLVMALYAGETLREKLRRGALPVAQALRYTEEVLEGLVYAHAAGVIHCDIKPANLLVTEDDRVKILDFGLAKLERNPALTSLGMAMGTLGYLPPEALAGSSAGAQADVWALGVVLFEMLCGTPPFRGEGAAVMLAILHDEPEPLSRYLPDEGRLVGLQRLLDRTLCKDPAGRFPSVEAFLLALRALSSPASEPQVPERLMVPHNLPLRPRDLDGREAELALLGSLLHDPSCPLVTLVSQGGMGKTRLALAAAQAEVARGVFRDGVYFVALETLHDAAEVPVAVAQTLGLPVSAAALGVDAWETVARLLERKRLLLVLDNFEGLMDAAGALEDVLRDCPALTLLVTSRERLNIAAESVLSLKGLPLPEGDTGDLEGFSSTRLFLSGARRQRPDFVPDTSERALIVSICRYLRGWPLGIELASSWLGHLSVAEILAQVQDAPETLGARTRHKARHASFGAVFAYSWALLFEAERALLASLSLFRSPFEHEAALQVSGSSLRVLATLVDKSLLLLEGGRYTLHPVVRQYAHEQLLARPDLPPLRLRFARYHAEWAQGRLPEGLSEAFANLRAAFEAGLEEADALSVRALLSPLLTLYSRRGGLKEGVQLFSRARRSFREPDLLAALSEAEATLHYRAGNLRAAQRLAGQALRLYPEDAALARGNTLNTLGRIAHIGGHYSRARYLFERALAVFERLEQAAPIASARSNLAVVMISLGAYAEAESLCREALESFTRLGASAGRAGTLSILGRLLLLQERHAEAQTVLEEARRLCLESLYRTLLPDVLESLARLSLARGELQEAQAQLSEALKLAQENGELRKVARAASGLGSVALARGNLPLARSYLALALKETIRSGFLPGILYCLFEAAEIHLYAGEAQGAAALLVTLEEQPKAEAALKQRARKTLASLTATLGTEVVAGARQQPTRDPLELSEEVLRELEA